MPLQERQNGTGYNQPVKGGGGPPQPPDGGGGGIGPLLLERGRRTPQCNWQVEKELLHLVVMEVVMGMMMIMEGVIDHLPQGEMEEMAVMKVMMEMVDGGDDSPPLSDQGQPQCYQNWRNRWVYVVQGPPRPPGQLGQDGRDG